MNESGSDSETEELDWSVSYSPSHSLQHDSTFDFETESEESNDENIGNSNYEVNEGSDDEAIQFSPSSSEGEEIWELSDSDTEGETSNESVERFVFGFTFFLSIFHTFYRLSERAMISLLSFLKSVFLYIGRMQGNQMLLDVAQAIPMSVHTLRKRFKNVNNFTLFTVCPKCANLYRVEDCIIQQGRRNESAKCLYVEFPNHPIQRFRSQCSAVLMKSIKVSGRPKLVPKKTYIYQSVVNALISLAKQPDFLSKCEHWRERRAGFFQGVLGDVYDGALWNEMQYIDGRPFLALPNNLCLAMNIDWFNPYEDSPYSVGVVYMVVLNLPRSERFKIPNVILVGMIPGPSEPTGDINSFLGPIVDDLWTLYKGVSFEQTSCLTMNTTIRAVLYCVTCDLPATRKTCGFSNFNALYGCSKCLKPFPTVTFGEKPDYSGYDWLNWPARDMRKQKEKGMEYRHAETHSARKEIVKAYGAKYSVLMELPAFDIVRCHTVDPMHAVFLGLAKHTTKTWKDKGIIGPSVYPLIQERVDHMVIPSKIGRIPRKICAGFASFTADEWKH